MEIVPNTFPALFWGYTAIVAIVVLYVVSLGFRISRIEKRANEHKPRS